MFLKYVGGNNPIGLTDGEVYDVSVRADRSNGKIGGLIEVSWKTSDWTNASFLYSSPAEFAKGWKSPRE